MEFEESVDPALSRVSTRWRDHLGRRYAGFIILLFGASDEDLATWFARSLIALDSLTGEEIACILFAKRLRVCTRRYVCRDHQEVGQTTHRDIFRRDLSEVDATELQNGRVAISRERVARADHDSNLVDSSGMSRWGGTTQEITAVTYATDEIARAIGVLDRLPCLVAVDATADGLLPTLEHIREAGHVLELSHLERSSIVAQLRKTVQSLRDQPSFQGFGARMRRYDELDQRASALERARDEAQRMITWIHAASSKITEASRAAMEHLMNGSARGARQALATCPQVDAKIRDEFAVASRARQSALVRLSKTIRSLEMYRKRRRWPLTTGRLQSMSTVLTTDAWPCLGYEGPPTVLSRDALGGIVEDLRRKQRELIDPLFNPLRAREAELREQKALRLGKTIEEYQRSLDDATAKLRELNAERAAAQSEPRPSLLRAFRAGLGPRPAQRRSPEQRTRIFCSYASEDSGWFNRLQVHLRPLIHGGMVELWDKTKIPPGANPEHDGAQAMARADVALLLISADFLASDAVVRDELDPILERAEAGQVRVILVIVGHCLFSQMAALSRFKPANSPGRPLAAMRPDEAEETLFKIACGVV
ncbi:toll/interleukin-1 receptor domain-containing protein [Sorangium sp. So ce260]|uniref:TIR domain-containing protein n=1 Tax=Sorangium sp. So ce260 TaxID=3133291 RepID=UPI003F62ADC8